VVVFWVLVGEGGAAVGVTCKECLGVVVAQAINGKKMDIYKE